MQSTWNRRRLLASVGALVVAGCTNSQPNADDAGGSPGGETPETELPAACPTTQDLGVDWPDALDESTVESFLEEYAHVYHRDVVIEYEPESRVDSYEMSVRVSDGPSEVGDGFEATVSGGGALYTPELHVGASVSDPPADADVVRAEEIDDVLVSDLVEKASEDGEATRRVERPGERVDRYIELFDALSEDFDPLSEPGDSDRLYVDVDGTTVEVSVVATGFHGDYGWDARYYVDRFVVRRTSEPDADPRDGELLECRGSL